MSAIVARGLGKRFGDVWAVEDLDLRVEPGEVVGFLGPNGAGKSTTIRMLLGQLRPTSGTAELFGRVPADPDSRRGVGYLPDDLAFEPRRTARQQLHLLAQLRGGVEPGRVDELSERFGLALDRKLGELSTGNRQKVGVVQAFMSDPELLILDEPTRGLDPLQQSTFREVLSEARHRGAAVLLSSHVLPEVEQIADRVAIVRNGQLVTETTVAELRSTARQRLTLSFDRSVPSEQRPSLDTVSGVVEHHWADDALDVVVEGQVQPVLDALSDVSVVRITSHDDDLDDLFLHLYEDDDE